MTNAKRLRNHRQYLKRKHAAAFTGVVTIPEDVHQRIVRGHEPTDEQEARTKEHIFWACAAIRGKHLEMMAERN